MLTRPPPFRIGHPLPERHRLGARVSCSHCGALMWPEEALKSGKGAIEERFSLCCGHGKVAGIELLRDPPQPLLGLYNRDHADHGHFLDNIRTYNSSFQMASTTAHLDPRSDQVPVGPGPMQFKINGEVHHRVGAALPATSSSSRGSRSHRPTPSSTWTSHGCSSRSASPTR